MSTSSFRRRRELRGCPAQRPFFQHAAALDALHPLDLVGNAVALAEHVLRDRLVAVPGTVRDWAAHLGHGSCALGRYDARTEEKL